MKPFVFSDPDMAIWRDATASDPLIALCSVVFDIDDRVVVLYPRGGTVSHEFSFDQFIPQV